MTEAEFLIVEGITYEASFVRRCLEPLLTDERKERIEKLLSQRCLDLRVVLDGIYDRGNALAVFRTAEALGLQDVHIVDTQAHQRLAGRSSSGAENWLRLHQHERAEECIALLKAKGFRIAVTGTGDSIDLDEFQPQGPVAIVMGNEHAGVSSEFESVADYRLKVPMLGMTQSLNVSVAAGICIQALRSKYKSTQLVSNERDSLTALFYSRSVKDVGRYLAAYRNRAPGPVEI